MPESFQPDPEAVRNRIIGLGDTSFRKSYYPQLQEKIRDLESKQRELMETVRSLEEHEAELEHLIREKNSLLREVHHRVKNNLQIISSLLRLGTDGHVSEAEMRTFLETRRRIDTIALVYNQLLEGDQFTALDPARLVQLIADAQIQDTGVAGVTISFDLGSCNKTASMDWAVPFALIVGELISNAFKHGCPGGQGCVRVSLRSSAPDSGSGNVKMVRTELCIEDSGPGLPDPLPDKSKSLGLLLVDILAKQLKAEWSLSAASPGDGPPDTGAKACLILSSITDQGLNHT